MNPRLATLAELCRETVLPASVLACVAFGAADAEYTKAASRAAPVVNRIAPALAADARAAHQSQPQPVTSNYAALGNAAPGKADVAIANAEVAPASANPAATNPASADAAASSAAVAEAGLQPTTEASAQAAPTEQEQTPPTPAADKPIVTASLGDPAAVLPQDTPPAQVATEAVPSSAAATNTSDGKSPVDTVAVLDECYDVDACVDRYLWALYQRTPKEDTAKEQEQRQVTVKRKGKLVTITRTVSSVKDEDFAWKDPKAADHAGMPIMDYVIGGVDRDFKMRLFRMLRAAEQAGLSPGITSAFRDDYRQSIASGLKAANDRSYHGGSFRGGYGHGLAADVVSTNGATRALRQASTEIFWSWIDKHGAEFGIGRPYLDHDPPHIAPIDGQEYASHNPKARMAAARARRGVAAHDDHAPAKRAKLARSS